MCSKVLCVFLAFAIMHQQVFAVLPVKFFPVPFVDPVGLFFLKKSVAVPAAIKAGNFAVIGAGLTKGAVVGAGAGLAAKGALLGGAGLLAGKAALGAAGLAGAAGLGLAAAKAKLALPVAFAGKAALLGGTALAGKAALLGKSAIAAKAAIAAPIVLPKALLLAKAGVFGGLAGPIKLGGFKLPNLSTSLSSSPLISSSSSDYAPVSSPPTYSPEPLPSYPTQQVVDNTPDYPIKSAPSPQYPLKSSTY